MTTNVLGAARRLALAATAIVTFAAATARASDTPSGPALRLEWAGLEVLPVSLSSGERFSGRALQGGPGGTLRILRVRGLHAYWTPLEAGLFVAPSDVILAHVQMEGGASLPVGDDAVEIGLGAGVGILAIANGNGCDGSCNVGGAGPMLSPVARYRFRQLGAWSLGVVLRAMIPLHVPDGDWFGYYTGRGMLILGGLDVAVGQ